MRRTRPADLAMAGLLAVTGVLEVTLAVPAADRWGAAMLVSVLAAVTLLIRSSRPILCLTLTTTLVVLTELPGTQLILTGTLVVVCLLALGSVGRHCRDPLSIPAVVGTTVIFVFGAAFAARPWDVVISCLACGAAWGAGRLLRREAARNSDLFSLTADLVAQQEAQAREAVQAERIRIAREVHDTIAHTVSVMTLQVGGVRRRLDTDAQRVEERNVLLAVEGLGREAVAELHNILGVLRTSEDEPAPATDASSTPRLADVPRLAGRVRAAGVPVDVRIEGQVRPLSAGLELAGYRVVQEALTNVLKHGSGAATRVTVTYTDTDVNLVIEDQGGAAGRASDAERVGVGLRGIRERVAVYGGRLEATPTSRGFSVRAMLPIGSA